MNRWFERSVVYQIYPLSFYDNNHDGIGDIQGIIMKLDYLKLLGIDILWLSPIYSSPMIDNGYDISNYYDINPLFGNLSDFKALLEKAHQLEMKIIMDLAVNHTSFEHHWFKEALKGRENPFRNFYIWRDEPNEILSAFTGSAWEFDGNSNQYYFHLFSKEQPDLNWDNPQLREEIYKMINWWLNLGIDGFRLDVIDLIGKDVNQQITYNGPKLLEYFEEMYQKCFKNKKVMTVGETPAVTTDLAKKYSKYLDMVFNFEHFTLDEIAGKDKWSIKKLDLKDLKQVFEKWQIGLHNKGWNSLFWSNHDSPRIISRFNNSKLYNEKNAKMLATMLHFMQGTPYIYQGEEIGMTNVRFPNIEDYKDLETINIYKEKIDKGWTKQEIMESIYVKSRDNARTPMQWDDGKFAGFSDVTPWIGINQNYHMINVEKNINDEGSIFYYYKSLIQLRKQLDIIIYGDFCLVYKDFKNLFAYKRKYKTETLLVICNFYDTDVQLTLDNHVYQLIIANYHDFEIKESLILRPYECCVLKY